MDDSVNTKQIGIKTTGLTKPLMVGCLTESINENPEGFRSKDLVSQFSTMVKSASGSVKSLSYSDLFMACSFCAYARKRKAIEIMPLIEFTNEQLGEQFLSDVKTISAIADPKAYVKHMEREEVITGHDDVKVHEIYSNPIDGDDDFISFLPFYSG